ncbi:predicted protein [Lichtheimia corymbifera JMRC:FSU:9682]|uniref:PX domain-containing protein n=1 Tax=Lichtheimia corymbifera JMRC:FSU:9682 TaxID=1263082 RepID=A0A068REZ7_9FUNG|nr:predicted protein [Lichtheimia corymbifera JMRC:FSU:9682]
MDLQYRLDHLIDHCYEGCSRLKQYQDHHHSDSTSLKISMLASQQLVRDLDLGIQRLSQLQHDLNEKPSVANDAIWSDNTHMVLDQVEKQLEHALNVLSEGNCSSSNGLVRKDMATPMLISSSSSSTASTCTTLSTSPDSSILFNHQPTVARGDAGKAFLGTSFGKTDYDPSWSKPNNTTAATRHLRTLFKGLRRSNTTNPMYDDELVPQINLCNQDNEQGERRENTFASDAIVNHPLRIGVGHGSYICYNCTVLSDKGPAITVRKRYSDFVELRKVLVKRFPQLGKSIPKLPPKRICGNFSPGFVEQRRRDLEYFFKYIVLHPSLGKTPIVMHWIAP